MNHVASKLGFYSAIIAFIAAAAYSVVQIFQVIGWLHYPMDAILIFGFSLFIALPFLLAILALHYTVAAEKKIWTHAALLFSVIYVVYVVLNYVVQLTAVIPHPDHDTVLEQTPHSLCWTLDALGYIFMGLANLVAIPAFGKSKIEKWVKGFFLANALVTPVIAVVYFYPTFSIALLLFGLPWIITAPGSIILLACYFKSKSPAPVSVSLR